MTDQVLADVANGESTLAGPLSWVGMERIDLPFRMVGQPVSGRVSAGVSLDDPGARGIHMSRLYLALAELENQEVTVTRIDTVLQHFLGSHQELSDSAYLGLGGDLLLKRPALISPMAGWKAYPVALRCRRDQRGLHVRLDLTIGYSSTCPCSAALARQSIQQAFDEDFTDIPVTHESVRTWLGSEQAILATPHSQRSQAHLSLRLAGDIDGLPVQAVIDDAERSLGTALQTAVKRVDEQAFALANGHNLMFCEDAARRLHHGLRRQSSVSGFQVRVVHEESLHAHDAVAHSEWRWRGEDS